MTSGAPNPRSIRIGVLAAEPILVEGLASIFDLPAKKNHPSLVPVIGGLNELLEAANIEYLVVDLQSAEGGFETLEIVRSQRPDIRLIVIGPEGDDELVLKSIIAGARAYLGLSAGPDVVRQALEVVTSGSIWAPRPLLSRLIDRLINSCSALPTFSSLRLTPREEQVLELVMLAQSTREIASRLGIEQRTVKAYIGRLMRKTGADNRVKLAASPLSRALLAQKGGKHRSTSGSNKAD